MRQLTENDLYGIGVVRHCLTLLPKKKNREKISNQVKQKNENWKSLFMALPLHLKVLLVVEIFIVLLDGIDLLQHLVHP